MEDSVFQDHEVQCQEAPVNGWKKVKKQKSLVETKEIEEIHGNPTQENKDQFSNQVGDKTYSELRRPSDKYKIVAFSFIKNV